MNKIYVVGLGPGAGDQMTVQAKKVLDACPVIIGYTYILILSVLYLEKQFLSTPMRKEADRCKMAFEEVKKGVDVAMVCSGDSGIYGMAGLIYEIGRDYPEIGIEFVPGITAASGGAVAVLGAPLMHDFAVISLSDLLTPWELIEKRLCAAAEADFVICLYNPSSRKRADYLEKACEIILKSRSEETVCGLVKNIGREGELYEIMTLKKLKTTQADMFTTVYIGNSNTKELNGKMVTPRGYKDV